MLSISTTHRPVTRGFFVGLASGLAVCILVAGFALHLLRTRGVTVHVDTEYIAKQVRSEVRAQVARELPGALARMRTDLPARVAAAATERIAGQPVSVGPFQVQVPKTMAAEMRERLEVALRSGFDSMLHAADIDQVADRVADQAAVFVKTRLQEALTERHLLVQLWPGVRVRVNLATR